MSAAVVTYAPVTCPGVHGIEIRCDGYEGLRRLGRLMARLAEGSVRELDLLAELPADAEGVASCVMERIPDEPEPTRSVFIDLQQEGAARVRWQNSAPGWIDDMGGLRSLMGAKPGSIQTFGMLRDDVAVVEVLQA